MNKRQRQPRMPKCLPKREPQSDAPGALMRGALFGGGSSASAVSLLHLRGLRLAALTWGCLCRWPDLPHYRLTTPAGTHNWLRVRRPTWWPKLGRR